MFVKRRSLNASILLHVGMLLVAAFGLPALLPDMPEPTPSVVTVELLPISEITNVKPSDRPIQKEQKAPKPAPKPEPKPQPKPEPKPQPKPESKPEPKPEPMEKPFDPNEGAEPKKPKPEPKPEPQEDEFKELLKDLSNAAEKAEKNAKDKTTTPENKTKSEAAYDETLPLSLSEEDALKNAYIPCWNPPIGSKDAEKLIVVLRVQYNTSNGSLIDVKISDDQRGRYASDPFFRAAADNALRAVQHPRCNPLRNLPQSLYPKLRDTKVTFDPRAMM